MTHLSEAILNDTKGIQLYLHDPLVAALTKDFADFLVVDTTYRSLSPQHFQAIRAEANGLPFLARIVHHDIQTVQGFLNAQIDGIILTDVSFAGEVEKTIAHCLYPPEGVRSFTTPVALQNERFALQSQNDQLTIVIEIARPQTVAQLEDIAEVTGVNGFLISPLKLAIAMERGFETDHADVKHAVHTIIATAENFGLPWGWDGALPPLEKHPGFQIMCSDLDLMRQGAARLSPSALSDDEAEFSLRAVR